MKLSLRQDAAIIVLAMLIFNLFPHKIVSASNDEIVYPLQVISKLECRFEDFDTLSSNCKEKLPILNTKDYEKYATKNGGYNDYTRLYTVLWGSSYKYGWDVGSGGHQGTDIATAKGTPVYSMADGKVVNTGNDVGWGKFVSIEHTINGQKVVSNYAHLHKISVNAGEGVDAGEKIGEVGSTGNSTGNHLHFQIDLPYSFHPYYYDWKTCPYSYYKITEEGVCFDDLAKHTIDPLLFLETNGAILEDIKITDGKNSTTSRSSKVSSNSSATTRTTDLDDIFDITVYYGYGTSGDVKAVQKLMKRLEYYNGSYTGDYEDVEKAVLSFQLEHEVITDKDADGAGWFGPKTRAAAKKAYEEYLSDRKVGFEEEDEIENVIEETHSTIVTKGNTVHKVSRENLLTREEIEAQEMSDFLKKYDVEVKNSFSQINMGDSKVSVFSITDKKDKGYKGNTPGNVTFSYDESKISIFPKSFYNFSDGTREITITGLSEGYTSIDIKIGEVIIDTIGITVGKEGKSKEVKSAVLFGEKSTTLGQQQKAVALLKDQYSNKLIGKEFTGNFTLTSQDNILFCLKQGKSRDVKNIYTRDCLPEEFTDTIDFNYNNTVGGLVLFEYKVLDSNARISLKNGSNEVMKKTITVTQIKNLSSNYEYYEEVMNGVMNGVLDGIDNRGYFSQEKELRESDAKKWILAAMKTGNYPQEKKNELIYTPVSRFEKLSREEFLEMTYKYLGHANLNPLGKTYKDLEEGSEILVASLLGNNYQWKDTFGEQYFQPDKTITRGEAAYMLAKALENMGNDYLVRN